MSLSRSDRKRAVIAVLPYCYFWIWTISTNVAYGFMLYSCPQSHCLVNKGYQTISGEIKYVAVATEKEDPTIKALKSRHGRTKRRKEYYALFMVKENFTDEQLDTNVEGNRYDDKEIDNIIDNDVIKAYNKNENGNGNGNAKYLLPGSKKLADFFSLPIVDVAQASLVLLSSLLVAIGTLQALPELVSNAILTTEDLIGGIFFLDFLFRWYSNGLKSSYLLNPFSIIDALFILPVILTGVPALAALLPSALSSSSGLINLRLLRILRLQLVLSDLETFGKFEIALGLSPSDIRPYQLQLARVILSIFTLISVSTGLIYTSEHSANPTGFPDYFTALYFGLTTLTTVGFGDIVPITFNGRLVVSGSILAGVAIIPIQAASFFDALLVFQKERQQGRDNGIIELERDVTHNSSLPRFGDDNIISTNTTSTVIDCWCKKCEANPHRRDAFFCWRCGAELTNTVDNDTS